MPTEYNFAYFVDEDIASCIQKIEIENWISNHVVLKEKHKAFDYVKQVPLTHPNLTFSPEDAVKAAVDRIEKQLLRLSQRKESLIEKKSKVLGITTISV